MKIKELQKIVNDLGLECDWGNNLHVIMQVWQPHKNGGYKIGSKYYSSESIGEKQVQELNDKFKKLLQIIKKHKLKIETVDVVENGIISQINLMVRFERLMQFEKNNLDFEVQDFEDWSGGKWINYNDVIPDDVGYGVTDFDVSRMFQEFKMKKHERELVIENIDELFSKFSGQDNHEWIMNFAVVSGDTVPLEIALERGILKPKESIETVFEDDTIYYQNEKEWKKVFKILANYKVDELNIKKYERQRGYLPEIVVTSPEMYKNVLANWDFTWNSGQRILKFLIENEYYKQFKQFIQTKEPKKNYFGDWGDLTEYFLKTLSRDDLKLTQEVFDNRWIKMEHIDPDLIIYFLVQQIKNEPVVTNEPTVIKEFIKTNKVSDVNKLFGILLGISRDMTLHIPEVLTPFFEVKGLDFKQADAEAMKYLDDNDPLKQTLYADSSFLHYLIDVDKLEYLPQEAQSVFLF